MVRDFSYVPTNRGSVKMQNSGGSGFLLESKMDFRHFEHIKPKLRCANNSAHLFCGSYADSGCGYCAIVQGPCDRHLTRSATVTVSDLAQEMHQAQVAGQQWFPEVRISASPVIRSELRYASSRYVSGQQSRIHG